MDGKYTSDQTQRTLALIVALAGNEFGGLSVAELAAATRTSADKVVRALDNLMTAGFAERMDNGRYRLGPKLVQISIAFGTALTRASVDLEAIVQRYTRKPGHL